MEPRAASCRWTQSPETSYGTRRSSSRCLGARRERTPYATPTPATDGKNIYAVFGDGSVAAVDFKGSVLWTNREVQFYSRHGLGASPLLYEGLLIMPYDGSNPVGTAGNWPNNSDEERLGWQIPWDRALIVALDVKTGERKWTGKRGKSRIAHVSPILVRRNFRTQLISPAGDAIQGFNPKTGELIWTVLQPGRRRDTQPRRWRWCRVHVLWVREDDPACGETRGQRGCHIEPCCLGATERHANATFTSLRETAFVRPYGRRDRPLL
jgi:hypothetical protein